MYDRLRIIYSAESPAALLLLFADSVNRLKEVKVLPAFIKRN